MVLTDPQVILMATMSMTIALVGGLICLAQSQDLRLFRILACFFAAIAITELGEALEHSITHVPTQIALNASWIVGAASAMPLFWLYVWLLTEPKHTWPQRFWQHTILPIFALLVFASVFTLSADDQRFLLTDSDGQISKAAFIVGASYEALAMFIVMFQWLIYLVLIARRLVRYRRTLRDVFASTQGKELRWVSVLILVCGTYWMLGFIQLVLDITGSKAAVADLPEYALNLIVSCILVVWGLRQKPGLRRNSAGVPPTQSTKYAKSALTPEMARRIAGKLKRAMEEDQLHSDPNLSLWALSKHVGVSDNYVSQVLNEEIGLNFFDFVNGHRIGDAQNRLATTDETILNIAYDTGFNSRSSFYTAFKKNTGQTPTMFRKNSVRTA
jgi:AraC-like DNA-binding protein